MNKHAVKIIFFTFCLSSLQLIHGSQSATTNSSNNNLLSSSWKLAGSIFFGIATPLLGYLAYHEYRKLNIAHAISPLIKDDEENVKKQRTALISSIQRQKEDREPITQLEPLFTRYMKKNALSEYQALSGLYRRDFDAQTPNRFTQEFDAMPLHQKITQAKNIYSNQKLKFGFATAVTILSAGTAGGFALWQFLGKK